MNDRKVAERQVDSVVRIVVGWPLHVNSAQPRIDTVLPIHVAIVLCSASDLPYKTAMVV